MPPVEIPVEASDTLAFTPESLKHLPEPPVFDLRAITSRDTRWQRRLVVRHCVSHSEESLRQIMREELTATWGEETAARFLPHLEEYWSALDEWKLQVQADPEIGDFTYDPAMRAAVDKLYNEVRRNSERYADALADNADAADLGPLILIAVAVKSFAGLEATAKPSPEYLTLEGVEVILKALERLEKANGLTPGLARAELVIACAARSKLPEEEVGNFASPSPSEADPTSSSDSTDSGDHGKSPASAKSPKRTSAA